MIPTGSDLNNSNPMVPQASRQRAALSPLSIENTSGGGGQQHSSSGHHRVVDMEVQVLNHCFDDIERFVSRLQTSVETARELEKRQKHRRSKKKSIGDGMLTMRAQLPQAHTFVDVFQKFKLSFNLLARLKAHIHDPNAPELVHFLFTPLALIVNTLNKDMAVAAPDLKGLTRTVWLPLLSRDAKELLLNCLTSREQDLWV